MQDPFEQKQSLLDKLDQVSGWITLAILGFGIVYLAWHFSFGPSAGKLPLLISGEWEATQPVDQVDSTDHYREPPRPELAIERYLHQMDHDRLSE